ncbi:hypothetical protein [Geomicrobium sp. JCM 19055]|uniref:hypothetical protein n=1 Tax=Geomicrobium sp. JCM 19055 TaxID=1460649 RepID=UPI00045ED373|nr:hypothetical protein [Geomicrobium sp. JCM 19055]GAK01374.1 hypothetical protein JCM19055_4534 [Geomicrobium sp. JCM 19055]
MWAFHDELKARLPKDTYVPNEDPLKLVLRAPEQLTGLQWEKVLQKQQIYVELSDHDYVLLFLPLHLEAEEAMDLKKPSHSNVCGSTSGDKKNVTYLIIQRIHGQQLRKCSWLNMTLSYVQWKLQ